jgi:hypothetical protein
MGHALRKPAHVPNSDLALSTIRPRRHRGAVHADPATLERVRAEFSEMRGFSPTPAQAARLFGLTLDDCEHVLAHLAGEGFLLLGPDGRYRIS